MKLRKTALDLITTIHSQNGFSHILISNAIEKNELKKQDENLLVQIVYGTVERKLTLDYYLEPFIGGRRLDNWVRDLLRMSVYQFKYLDKVPDYAIINEAVEIAKQKGHRGTSSLVNGVLRNIQRKGLPNLDKIEDPLLRLSIETSHPKWLIERLNEQYGYEITEKICQSNLTRNPLTLRVKQPNYSREKVISELAEEGVKARPSSLTNAGIIIEEGNVIHSDAVKRGKATIQDESSMLVGQALDVKKEMKVLDTCSAPGGKTTHIAELMEDKGKVYAHDLHENKIKQIKQHANRLKLDSIEASATDARNLSKHYKNNTFDRILVDAPCSGLGVMRSKPDIKYSKTLDDINRLHQIQLDILLEVAPLLKDKGKLVYSTCTLDKHENEEVIQAFLELNPNYQLDLGFIETFDKDLVQNSYLSKYGIQLFPYSGNSDGFFISRLVKKR